MHHQVVDPERDGWRMTHGGTISVDSLDVANLESSMLRLGPESHHHDRSLVSTPGTSHS